MSYPEPIGGSMRTGTIAEIRSMENGFCVCVRDPAIVKANSDSKKPWRDPEREYVFDSLEKALKWIKANATKLTPEPDGETEFNDSYARATSED